MSSVNLPNLVRLALAAGLIVFGLSSIDCFRTPPVYASIGSTSLQQSSGGTSLPDPSGPKLSTEEIRSPTSKDSYRRAAETALADGEQLLKEWKAESSRKAIDKFKESLKAWRIIGDQRKVTLALKRIGDVYQTLGEYQNALAFYDQALSITRQVRDRRNETGLLNDLAHVHLTWGNNNRALDPCRKALRLSQVTADRRERARALNNLGEIAYGSGRLQQSIEYYSQALPIWQELGDLSGQALTLLNFGYTYSDLGEGKQAFDYYNQALSLWRTATDNRGQAITLLAIGRLYSRIGESQQALDFFWQAKNLIQPLGDPLLNANVDSGIAFVYDQLGEEQKAIEGYEQALAMYRSVKHRVGEANILGDAGRLYFSIGNSQKALECHRQALSIFRAVGDRRMEIFELREIGRAYDSQGQRIKALKNYGLAQTFYRSEKDYRGETDTLGLIGRAYEEEGQGQKALEHYDNALQLSRKAEYRVGEAAMLHNLARIYYDLGNLAAARPYAEEALSVVEFLREKVNMQDLRTSYFASVRQLYEFYIDLLMRLHWKQPAAGFDRAAFEASEKARVRSFLEMLAAARIGFRESADPDLLKLESKLSNELNQKAILRMKLQASDKQPDVEAQALAKEINELTWQLREVEAQIRAGGIKPMGSLSTKPLGLTAIQQEVLDDNSLLLEYTLGDERSYLWAVTTNEFSSFELPGRAEIEAASRNLYKLLIASQPTLGETPEQRQARLSLTDEQLNSEIAKLSSILLSPIVSKLGTKRLLIVPDGALQYIPFSVLMTPSDHDGKGSALGSQELEAKRLITDHEIVNEPSASSLALLLSNKTTRKPPQHAVAVLADPVFEVNDSRITGSTTADPRSDSKETEVQRAFRDVSVSANEGQIPRLWASGDEAEAIMSIAPWRSGFKATGFEASRSTAMSADLGNYRIVHFATHGFLNDEHPELSGIVLSLYDKNGQPQDGFLRLHDIYNLKLPVDLVVLSACSTGLGKDVKGEGLIGLTRGFMYAGAGSVVASLWKVDDEATAQLMGYFYRFMLKDGLPPAAALRQAQIKMSQQTRWQSPYYWAGFVIQGQYGQRPGRGDSTVRWLALTICMAAVVGLSTIVILRRRRRRLH